MKLQSPCNLCKGPQRFMFMEWYNGSGVPAIRRLCNDHALESARRSIDGGQKFQIVPMPIREPFGLGDEAPK